MLLALEKLNLLFFLLLNREEIRHTESCNVPNGQIVEQYNLPNKSDIICEFSCFYFSRMGCRRTVFSVPGAARRGSLR